MKTLLMVSLFLAATLVAQAAPGQTDRHKAEGKASVTHRKAERPKRGSHGLSKHPRKQNLKPVAGRPTSGAGELRRPR